MCDEKSVGGWKNKSDGECERGGERTGREGFEGKGAKEDAERVIKHGEKKRLIV